MKRTTSLRVLAASLLVAAMVWFWGRYALFPLELTIGNTRFFGWGLALLAAFGSYKIWMKAAELSEDGEDPDPASE